MNYLASAKRDKSSAIRSIVIGVVIMFLYVAMIAIPNLVPSIKTQVTAQFDTHLLRTLVVFLSACFVVFMTGFLLIARGIRMLDTYVPVGISASSASSLANAILAVSGSSTPFAIKRDGNYLTAAWKIAEANWYTLFGKEGLSEQYTLYLRLNESAKTVYGIEWRRSLNWSASVPAPSLSFSFTYGWHMLDMSYQMIIGLKEINPLSIGKVCEYSYSVNTIRLPIINEVLKKGWTFKPCLFSLRLGV